MTRTAGDVPAGDVPAGDVPARDVPARVTMPRSVLLVARFAAGASDRSSACAVSRASGVSGARRIGHPTTRFVPQL